MTLQDALDKGLVVVPVPVAGAWLGMSRNKAYQQARRFVETDGAEGLPVLHLGQRYVVPIARIQRMLGL